MLRRSSAAFGALLTVLLLAACSSSITSDLGRSVGQSLSAAQTARLTLVQVRDGRVVDGVSSTAFTDMLTEAQGAESSASAGSPPTAGQLHLRNQVLAVLHASTTAVLGGQDAAEQVPGAPSKAVALRRLDVVLQQLEDWNRRLGSGR